jgi:hypothetical protein
MKLTWVAEKVAAVHGSPLYYHEVVRPLDDSVEAKINELRLGFKHSMTLQPGSGQAIPECHDRSHGSTRLGSHQRLASGTAKQMYKRTCRLHRSEDDPRSSDILLISTRRGFPAVWCFTVANDHRRHLSRTALQASTYPARAVIDGRFEGPIDFCRKILPLLHDYLTKGSKRAGLAKDWGTWSAIQLKGRSYQVLRRLDSHGRE